MERLTQRLRTGISIHAPREGGDRKRRRSAPTSRISIHAPREGGDVRRMLKEYNVEVISIHAPREGGDGSNSCFVNRSVISIHAPREGGDAFRQCTPPRKRYFNPRPPRGGRREQSTVALTSFKFQSTPPARGATNRGDPLKIYLLISIHAPREGGDCFFLGAAPL